MAASTGARKTEPSDERRVQLCAAAKRAIARKGLSAVTMKDIAAEAGMSAGIVSYYFENKQGVLWAAFEAVSEAYGRGLREKLREGRSTREILEHALTAPFRPELLDDELQPAEFLLVWVEYWAAAARDDGLRELIAPVISRWSARLASVIRTGQERGEIDAGLDPKREVQLLRSLLSGQAIDLNLYTPREEQATAARRIAATLRDYLGERLYREVPGARPERTHLETGTSPKSPSA